MVTGADLYKYIQQKWGKPYSRSYDPTKVERLWNESVNRGINGKLDKPAEQKSFDDLSAFLKSSKIYTPVDNSVTTSAIHITAVAAIAPGLSPTVTIDTLFPHKMEAGDLIVLSNMQTFTYTAGTLNGQFTVATAPSSNRLTFVATGVNVSGMSYQTNSGLIYSVTGTIADYDHLITVKAKFLEPLTKPGVLTAVSITGVSNASQMVVTAVGHNRRVGEKVVISGVTGTAPLTTNINAEHTIIEVVTKDKFKVAASGVGGTYTSGGTISAVHYEYCTILRGDEEIGLFGEPSYTYPRVKQYEKTFKFFADKDGTRQCTEASFTYVNLPAITVSMTNAFVDLEPYYTRDFMYFICDLAVQNYAGANRDGQLFQVQNQAIIQNQ